MRRFHSYEEVDPKIHYYVPRKDLIEQAHDSLLGDDPDLGGQYITVWGPRQSGKTWVMRQLVRRLKGQSETGTEVLTESPHPFDVAILSLQPARPDSTVADVLKLFVTQLEIGFGRDFPTITTWEEVAGLFTVEYFQKPVILILDEFDSMGTDHINRFAAQFRHIYISRRNETGIPTGQKHYVLHGLALIGVRSVLGIENVSGSPFNIQRSLPIPNLTFKEVDSMFHWYERESGQTVEQGVIDRVFYETQGQPGLVSWLGEQLTEKPFNHDYQVTIDMAFFERVYGAALYILPNNNILNLISKARQAPYKQVVLELFKTDEKLPFRYDDPLLNFLYMNGVLSWEEADGTYYTKFPSPFVQRRLFNAFARDMFPDLGRLHDPFDDLSDTIGDDSLNVTNLMRRYEIYLRQNRDRLLKNAPRRKSDDRVMEATYHFNLYLYLQSFFYDYKSRVHPEFPTGNGKIDLLIHHGGQLYGLEVKSFSSAKGYQEALKQAACYGKQLKLSEISLVFFCEYITDENREKYEQDYQDEKTGVLVEPVFVMTG